MILMTSTLQPRVVGTLAGALIAVLLTGAPLGEWWTGFRFGGLSLGAFAIPTAALLGAWRGPRLRDADHTGALREAILFALLAVPFGALLTAIPGTIEIAVTEADIPLLAPFGFAVFGLLIVGPAALLVALPAAVLWAEIVRFTLRRLAPSGAKHIWRRAETRG